MSVITQTERARLWNHGWHGIARNCTDETEINVAAEWGYTESLSQLYICYPCFSVPSVVNSMFFFSVFDIRILGFIRHSQFVI